MERQDGSYSGMGLNTSKHRIRVLFAIVIATLVGAVVYGLNIDPAESVSQEAEVAAQSDGSKYVRTELYYGAGMREERGDYKTVWNQYLDEIVTPRFPEGLTLIEATGQWRVKPGQKPRRSGTMILVLIHEATEDKLRKLDEIRSIWKERSGHRSVLKVTVPADIAY